MKTESRREMLDRYNEIAGRPNVCVLMDNARDILKLANAQEEIIEKQTQALHWAKGYISLYQEQTTIIDNAIKAADTPYKEKE